MRLIIIKNYARMSPQTISNKKTKLLYKHQENQVQHSVLFSCGENRQKASSKVIQKSKQRFE